ncbi:hypothetical protein WJX73_004770 [Symbiochloris irregularis]|uniref:rRNA methyltransferase 2, mitochondrial n=1 Tax=Symbiochloris irregularis TaxID=706552 RepID=A0AAW1NYA0_9CHLO
MSRNLKDFFFKQAKRHGFLARSAFKLTEIQERFRVIRAGGSVLDLGCCPGAWIQVALQAITAQRASTKPSSLILGVDLKTCRLPQALEGRQQIQLLEADARHLQAVQLLQHCRQGFHTVLSDMCPDTSGIAAADVARSLELAGHAVRLALSNSSELPDGIRVTPPDQSASLSDAHETSPEGPQPGGVLLPEGHLVVKVLSGSGCNELHDYLRHHFRKVVWAQPKASRSESREMYLVGLCRQLTNSAGARTRVVPK